MSSSSSSYSRSHLRSSESLRDARSYGTPTASTRFSRERSADRLDAGSREEGDASSGIGIGFATLPEQIHRKSVKRGFDFTLMVVGESGLGKSTLTNSMFLTDLYKDRKLLGVEERIDKTVNIEKKMLEIEERGVKLRLTIVDTPGFGDAVNNEECWEPVEAFIDSQFEQYFKDESGLNRKNIQDNRVHCCLYFISPIGHGLRPIDKVFMKRLHNKVNIIPVIAKADTMTMKEIQKLKAKVRSQLADEEIRIYQFPDCDSDEDEDYKKQDEELKQAIPFAVIGSNQILEVNGKRVRGRQYPWGIVEVENPKHSDFSKLRSVLVSTHMQDLKDVTRDVHYENYRATYITKTMRATNVDRSSAVVTRAAFEQEEQKSSKEKLLKQKDAEIARMQEMISQMQRQLTTTSNNNSAALNQLPRTN